MKPEQQRIAIAEVCGWKRVDIYEWIGNVRTPKQWVDFDVLPDYPSDLNAMHEAEKVLTPEESSRMVCEVSRMHIATGSLYTFNSALLHASAAQRAEAFLKTIGKWKESE